MGERESFNADGVGDSDERSGRTATLSFAFFGLNPSTVLGDPLDYGPSPFCLIFCISSTIPLLVTGMFCRTYGIKGILRTHCKPSLFWADYFVLYSWLLHALSLADGRSNSAQELIYLAGLHDEINSSNSAVGHTITGAKYRVGAQVFRIGN